MSKHGIRHNWGWIQLELTDSCNLRCVMCPQGGEKDYSVHNIFKEDSAESYEYFSLESDAELAYMIISPEFQLTENYREELLSQEPMKKKGTRWATPSEFPGFVHYLYPVARWERHSSADRFFCYDEFIL